jgi:DNA-binding NarL/FixJ family response regulator
MLLVEDNLGDARLVYEGLTEALATDFQVTHVRRLREALEWLWEESCDLVLLDMGLPDSHGLDTLLQMRAQAPIVPIVVFTGFNDESFATDALQKGAQGYLVKEETNSQELLRSLRYAVASKADARR